LSELENIGKDAAIDYMQMPQKPADSKESLMLKLKILLQKWLATQKVMPKEREGYFSGTYIDERDAPIPGVPCLTGLLVIANSPK